MVAKCLQSKDTTSISPLEAGLSLGLAFGPLGAIFELLKHMGLQSVQQYVMSSGMYGAHDCGVTREPVLFNTAFSLEKSCTACFFCPAMHVLHASTCSFYLPATICYLLHTMQMGDVACNM